MERTSIKTIERFEYEGQRYKREVSNSSVEWKFYNTGWGEHGWLPLKGSSEKVKTPEEMERMYQNEFGEMI